MEDKPQEIQDKLQEIQDKLNILLRELQQVREIQDSHSHTGADSQQLRPSDFLGFPIISSSPTDQAQNGTIRLLYDGSTTYELYVRINNSWKKATLS